MSSDNTEKSVDRRQILKAAGVAGAAGLAGCTGGGGGNGGGGGGGSGGGGGGGGGGGSGGGGGGGSGGGGSGGGGGGDGMDFSGVKFEYWNIINIQTRNARALSEDGIKEAEDKFGFDVTTNFSSYTDLAGAKWINRFKAGNYPVLYDSDSFLSGHLIDGGWVLPQSEYVDRFSNQDIVDRLEWLATGAQQITYRGFEGNGLDRVYETPFGGDIRQPHIVRTDHWEQAGLDPSYSDSGLVSGLDDLISKAKTLQEDGPADITLPVFGASHDWSDVTLVEWATIKGKSDGLYLAQDWSEPNFLNDVWKDTYQTYVNIHLKEGLSSPKTPTLPDEDAVPELIAGNWSNGWADPFNHGGFIRQAPDMMNDGTITYNPQWDGPGGNGQPYGLIGFGLQKPPDGADENTWKRKQDAAIAFMEHWLTEDFQVRTFDGFGSLPTIQEVWGDIERSEHHLMDYYESVMSNEKSKWAVGAHPQMSRIYSTLNAPIAQNVLKGSVGWEEGLNQMTEKTNGVLGRWREG